MDSLFCQVFKKLWDVCGNNMKLFNVTNAKKNNDGLFAVLKMNNVRKAVNAISL